MKENKYREAADPFIYKNSQWKQEQGQKRNEMKRKGMQALLNMIVQVILGILVGASKHDKVTAT
ncbi:hypothetical protein FOXG_21347 [Fusarium oxysporum f. sp. lycopersici 4287]|nr:hypothetical protein FOXG_21347 [Fusarium oxysporum f. sp. lycopersici 4287]KNB15496.1 hypothetical protein FOXG_21347 [Fusarium oxysporum f. sp. lycopersici 4287]